MEKKEVNTFIMQQCKKYEKPDSPGASVAIISDGELVDSYAFGMANLEHSILVDDQTIFDIGSASKQFTAYAIAMLDHEGKLNLDDDIHRFLPFIPDFGKAIKIKHLIYHTSGLHNHFPLFRFIQYSYSIEDIKRLVQNQTSLEFKPGDRFEYNNTGYGLLALIVEKVTGQTFPQWMKENIFNPLGMENTFVNEDYSQIIRNRAKAYSPDHSRGYINDQQAYPYGFAAIFSNALDLSKWINNLETGKVGGMNVIGQIKEQGTLNNGEAIPYAFGLFKGKMHGSSLIEHGGEARGFRSAISFLPDRRTGIVVLANSSDFNVWDIVRGFYDTFIFQQYHPASVSQEIRNEIKKDFPYPDFTLYDTLLGKYLIEPGHVVTITKENNALLWKLPGSPKFKLTPVSEYEFYDQDGDSVSFKIENNTISGVKLLWDGRETLANKLPEFNETDLSDYAGKYYCQDIDQVFTIVAEDTNLIAKNLEHGEIFLESCGNDQFGADPWWFRLVDFERNSNKISGFVMTTFGFKSKSQFQFKRIHFMN